MLEATLSRIRQLQSPGNAFYPRGIFPSQRIHKWSAYQREDNNIFFSALVVFTLQQLKSWLSDDLNSQVDQIIKDVVRNYPNYCHPADRSTYNFWQDQPQGHFPHGFILSKLSFMALPGDADDTAIIYLTHPPDYSIIRLKQKLEAHYPSSSPSSPLTPAAYQDLKAYPTFLGRRVQREMDACVISNVLYMVFYYKLPLSPIDHQSIEFIFRVIEREDYRKSSFLISPNYGQVSVILYHIARLVASFNHTALAHLRAPLINSLKKEYQRTTSFMDLLLISTGLLRFGICKPVPVSEQLPEHHFREFYFFQAGMLTSLQRPELKTLTTLPFFHLKYRCQAYYYTLWLEYQVLYKKVTQGHPMPT